MYVSTWFFINESLESAGLRNYLRDVNKGGKNKLFTARLERDWQWEWRHQSRQHCVANTKDT